MENGRNERQKEKLAEVDSQVVSQTLGHDFGPELAFLMEFHRVECRTKSLLRRHSAIFESTLSTSRYSTHAYDGNLNEFFFFFII